MTNSLENITLCSHCILPSTFPGIKFDDQGVCSYCRRDEAVLLKSPEKKAQYRLKLDELVRTTKGRGSAYDVIAAYSGGKDSSYTLKLLRELYDLRILALTLDNNFVAPQAVENIRAVTDILGIDHIIFKPNWSVMKSVFTLTARALEMNIPLIAFGWSPGQAPIQSAIMKTNAALIRENQKALKKALPDEIVQEMSGYLIPDSYYSEYQTRFPVNVHPLAFFDYDEEKIKTELENLGWKVPTNTDSNSTNCQVNAFANQIHIQRHGFHPYVWEIANMIRQGVMNREEGIEKIYQDQDSQMVAFAKEKLGL
jgi:hypothetical protein